MICSTSDARLWAGELAARVRLLQSSCADGETDTRRHVVEEEIERALKGVALGKRCEYMDALDEQFPTMEPVGQSSPAPAAEASSPLPADPAALAVRLVELVPASGPEREAVLNCLEQAGLVRSTEAVAAGAAEVPAELVEWFGKLLGDKPLDIGRSFRLLNVLVEVTSNSDQLVWQVWKKIAPKTLIQQENGRANELRKMLGPYLSGDPEVSTEQIKQSVAKTRKLISGLLAAIGAVGGAYLAGVLDRLSPDKIKQLVQAETGVFESVEKKCWRKYNAVFGEFSPASVEKGFLEAVKKYTEKLVLGPQAVRELEE